MPTLWNQNQEKDFFIKSLEFATSEQLFYVTKNKKYLAYWPKNYDGTKTTLQSRNSLIGSYMEKWATDLFNETAHRVKAKLNPRPSKMLEDCRLMNKKLSVI